VSWCTGTEGLTIVLLSLRLLRLAVEHCWVFCIGSCEPVYEDRTMDRLKGKAENFVLNANKHDLIQPQEFKISIFLPELLKSDDAA